MASGSQLMTTYYAKRIVGDASAAQADKALLQTGTNVVADTWILNRTNRATTYGIKYVYDGTDGHDKLEFYGGSATASAWVQLDTGDILVNNIDSHGNINLYFADGIGIGLTNNGHIESTQANDYRKGVYFTDTNGNIVSWHESYIMENRTNTMFESANLVNDTLVYGGMQIQIRNSGESYISLLMTHASSNGSSRMIDMCHYTDNTNEILLNADTKPRTTNVYNLGSASRIWKDAYIYNLNIGTKEVTTAPTELTASNRIIITPYFHTGGPWYIKSMDNSSDAFLALYYGNAELLRIKHEGTFQASIKANITGNAATATRINGNLAAATSDVNRNIWVSSTASADGIPNYISYFNMNPSTNVFTVPAGTRIYPNAGALYLGNSGNQSWVYVQDMCSQDGQKWKIHQNGAAEFTGAVQTGTINATGDLNLYTSSADSPDIVWWYANKGTEQARIWVGSGGTSTFAPTYRCYNSSGTQLYSGCLVLGNGTGASGTWGISITGNAATATALTSNAGGTEQPIYFTGGKPAATSYALKATVNNGTATYLAYYSGARAISSWSAAKFHDGCLSLFPTASSYREGMRIHSVGSWSDITLCGNDNTGDSGTSANSWFIGNNNGNFYIARNGSPGSTAYIGCVSNVWHVVTAADIPEGATNLSGAATAHTLSIYRNGITIPYQMDNANDGGMLRVRGTTESNCIFELGTWDDSGAGETIQFNYYPTTSQVTPTYSISVPKHSGTLVTTDGHGASGTWGISISGNAASATYLKDRTNNTASYLNYGAAGLAASAITWLCCWNGYEVRAISKTEMANAVDSAHKWVRIGGDTMTGVLHSSYKSGSWVNSLTNSVITLEDAAGSYGGWICGPTKNGRIAISTYQNSDDLLYIGYGERGRTTNSFTRSMTWNGANGRLTTASIANAIWNDIAESRVSDTQIPGYVIAPGEDKIAHITTKRLQSAGRVISDTYGYLLGDEDDKHAPIAIAGRVLAYPLYDKSYYEVGDAVCAAEGGKIDKMTRDEIKEYPDRIIGIVNEIPDYDIWEPSREGGGREPIHTNGRIWIDVR